MILIKEKIDNRKIFVIITDYEKDFNPKRMNKIPEAVREFISKEISLGCYGGSFNELKQWVSDEIETTYSGVWTVLKGFIYADVEKQHKDNTFYVHIGSKENKAKIKECTSTCTSTHPPKWYETNTAEAGKKKKKGKEAPKRQYFVYEGQYYDLKTGNIVTHQKTFLTKKPLVINDWFISEFINETLLVPHLRHLKLIGVSLVKQTDESPEPKLKWVRVIDKGTKPEEICWAPALFLENEVLSLVGPLIDSGESEDVREFTDCPIPGYKVVKED